MQKAPFMFVSKTAKPAYNNDTWRIFPFFNYENEHMSKLSYSHGKVKKIKYKTKQAK